MSEHLGLLQDKEIRVVVATNTGSTNANGFIKEVERAKHDFNSDPDLKGRLLILPHRDNFGHTVEDIQDAIRPCDIVVVGGGDGSGNGACQAVMNHWDRGVRDTVAVLAMPGGNANLGSNDLLEKQGHYNSILSILARGRIINFSPMSLTIDNPTYPKPRVELAYFLSGVGAPGYAELQIEKNRKYTRLRRIKALRFLLDAAATIQGAHQQNQDPVQMSVNGTEFEGAGLLTANVNRYAKVLRTPARSTIAGFDSLVFPKANLLSESVIATQALFRGRGWMHTDPDDRLEIDVTVKPGQLVYYEVDAEVRGIMNDPFEELKTHIVQKVHDQKVKMVSVSRV